MNHRPALSESNADYLEYLYSKYMEDTASVDASWQDFFSQLNKGPTRPPEDPSSPNGEDASATARAFALIRAYRERGHLIADTDPLGLSHAGSHPDLNPATHGITDMHQPISLFGELGLKTASPGEIETRMQNIYCGTLAAEFMHLDDPKERAWIQTAMESDHERAPAETQRWILEQLTQAEVFEQFMQLKFPGVKRYGLEGCESQLPLVETILQCAAVDGVEEIVIGPMHRGRTTLLGTFMRKPLQALFAEFAGQPSHPSDLTIAGDVPFHLGHSTDRRVNGATVHISWPSHPSHVEAIIPVALGKTRAKQGQRQDATRRRVLGLMMHTDAAFIGQGIVSETFQLSLLPGYNTGGSIHVIVNNQIGFTTTAAEGRSSTYCSDSGKVVQTPVFHVNGDDPEAVVRAANLALHFRQRFGRDVIVDLVCYRRRGHNEVDEPSFTQPLMYRRIDQLPTIRQHYADKLIEQGVITQQDAAVMIDSYHLHLEEAFESSEQYRPNKPNWLSGRWANMKSPSRSHSPQQQVATGVDVKVLHQIGAALCSVPTTFDLHPKIRQQLDSRNKALRAGHGISWASGEALAFGSILRDGMSVRLSGQDSRRGTFSQRHAVLYDQQNDSTYTPLNHVADSQGLFEIWNSPLSEAAVVGFEYGYSLTEPNVLVLWEAQFGDFANGAQIFIDQFVSAGEEKWLRMSGLVMLLPHGVEGGGPEHSSARLERFLQLCSKHNLQVVNCTTPANYFHVLRRQMQREFRKPLVVMTPKSLLRHRLAVSSLAEIASDTCFQPVLPETDTSVSDQDIRRVVLCSGRIFYDLLEQRRHRQISDIAVVRIEEIYPFPESLITRQLARYPQADVVWCQEEPRNMGAWSFLDRRIEKILRDIDHSHARARYVGRLENPSPGAGIRSTHDAEHAEVIAAALDIA
ncbi:MAG: 2-oxoglutarate dehydrogenase E1 component [Gammaproteobacteria bacterium]|nr:2-oxoglutarate dehydrogenase E1 component [Gammaproteobacteria bacterium]